MPLSTQEKFIILINNDRLKKSDAIVLLEGDGLNRLGKVVELYKSGWADKILFSGGINDLSYGSYPYQFFEQEFVKNGIPPESIIIDNVSHNTQQQAINVMKIVKDNEWKRIIIVASHYHQFRAYLTFLKEIINQYLNIEMINAPANQLTWFEKLEWGERFNLLLSEFEKIEQYSSLGHLATYEQAIEYQKWKEHQI